MLDLARQLDAWAEDGRDFAVATVVGVDGSAPRGPGAALAVDGEGTVLGSVSGGCVEGAVHDLCLRTLETGEPVLERFGYSDEDAFAVGLTCGGVIDVLVVPVGAGAPARPVFRAALSAALRGAPAALARVTRGPAELLAGALYIGPDGAYEGGLGGTPELDRTAAAEAHALLQAGRAGTVQLAEDGSHCGDGSYGDGSYGEGGARDGDGSLGEGGSRGEGGARGGDGSRGEDGSQDPGGLTLFVEVSVAPPRMIVFGAIDFAAALVRAGSFLGYHVTVCDARPVFATRARFPEADDVVVDWPHRYLRRTATDARTVLCVLTHDAKFDIPLLTEALRMPVAYVGAMGSRRTHADRDRRLREAGLADGELARLRSPIGLDLGARTPEETALSIAAEIVATRNGGTGTALTDSDTPIHRDGAAGARRPAAAA